MPRLFPSKCGRRLPALFFLTLLLDEVIDLIFNGSIGQTLERWLLLTVAVNDMVVFWDEIGWIGEEVSLFQALSGRFEIFLRLQHLRSGRMLMGWQLLAAWVLGVVIVFVNTPYGAVELLFLETWGLFNFLIDFLEVNNVMRILVVVG